MISRTILKEIIKTINNKPVTVITGARQVGKTTLCSLIEKELGFNYVSLANPILMKAAKEDPSEFLSLHPFPLIIDEIQKVPELFEYLEGKVDEQIKTGNKRSLYVLTGSQTYRLMKGVKESMAGRIGLISMPTLSLSEINKKVENPFKVDINTIQERISTYKLDTISIYDYIIKGFYPELYNSNIDHAIFYSDYVESYIERDVSDLISLKDKHKFIDFMIVLASYTGNILIYENISNAVGVDIKTIQNWISVLLAGDIIHLLYPYNEYSNIKKVTRKPKLYFSDTGLACFLAGINSTNALISSYLKGNMMETFIINEIIKSYKNNNKDKETSFYYYRNSKKEEIDLIIINDGNISLIECKSGEEYNSSDIKAFDNLNNTRLKLTTGAVICTTKSIYPIKKGVFAIPITAI